MTLRDLAPDLAPTSPRRCPETTSPPAPPPTEGRGRRTSPRDLAPAPRHGHLSRQARAYLGWLDQGGISEHLPRLVATLDDHPRTRPERTSASAASRPGARAAAGLEGVAGS